MVNPQMEVISGEGLDSTEVGRIVPIYERSARLERARFVGDLRRLQHLDTRMPMSCRRRFGRNCNFHASGSRIQTHFPPAEESLDASISFGPSRSGG